MAQNLILLKVAHSISEAQRKDSVFPKPTGHTAGMPAILALMGRLRVARYLR